MKHSSYLLMFIVIVIASIFALSFQRVHADITGPKPFCIKGYCCVKVDPYCDQNCYDSCMVSCPSGCCDIDYGNEGEAIGGLSSAYLCDDNKDNDCDGLIDEADGGGSFGDVGCQFSLSFEPNTANPQQEVVAIVTPAGGDEAHFPTDYGDIVIYNSSGRIKGQKCSIGVTQFKTKFNCTFTAPPEAGNYEYTASFGKLGSYNTASAILTVGNPSNVCTFDGQGFAEGDTYTADCSQLGECSSSVRTCQADGTWTECSILPSSEICNDGLDNDCDGKSDCLDSDCNVDASCAMSVSGTVLDEQYSTSIPSAEVVVTYPDSPSVSNTTNILGGYIIHLTDPGQATIEASASGYDPAFDSFTIDYGSSVNKDFGLLNGSCHTDCTDSNGECNYAGCLDTTGGCTLCSGLSEDDKNRIVDVCKYANKGERRSFNESHYIVCCGSTEGECPPFVEKEEYSGDVESCADVLMKSTRLAWYESRPVTIEVYVWNSCE